MARQRSKVIRSTAVVAAAALLAACGGDDESTEVNAVPASLRVNVVSAADPVHRLLGEIYVQALERNGVRVGRKDPLPDQDAVLDRLAAGEVQMAPGLLLDIARRAADRRGEDLPDTVLNASTSAEAVLAAGGIMPAEVFLGDASAASAAGVIACSVSAAERFELVDLASLADVADEVRIAGADGSDTDAAFGLGVVGEVYGAEFTEFVASADPVAAVIADDADCAITDALDTDVVLEGLLPLDDPEGAAPPNVVVPVFSADGRTPDVLAVLSQVNGSLTTEVLRALLVKVEQEDGDVAGVARDYLATQGG